MQKINYITSICRIFYAKNELYNTDLQNFLCKTTLYNTDLQNYLCKTALYNADLQNINNLSYHLTYFHHSYVEYFEYFDIYL